METTLMREVLRWGGAVGCFGMSFYLAKVGYENAQYDVMLFGALAFVLGVIIIWKPLFRLITRPFMLFIDSIFSPGGPLEKPTLNLKLPAYYIENGRFEEAREEYVQILKHYPDEVEAYEKLIWLEAEIFENRREARKLLRKARRRMLTLSENLDRWVELP